MPERNRPEPEYETILLREVKCSFPSGVDTTILYPEDTLETDALQGDGWVLRMTSATLGWVVTVYPHHLQWKSIREFPHRRIKL